MPRTEFQLAQVEKPPVVIRREEPCYPAMARRQNREGKVVVRFLVDEKGRVRKPSIVEANPEGLFEENVLKAIEKWLFEPGRYQGKAVSTWIVVPIHFRITG